MWMGELNAETWRRNTTQTNKHGKTCVFVEQIIHAAHILEVLSFTKYYFLLHNKPQHLFCLMSMLKFPWRIISLSLITSRFRWCVFSWPNADCKLDWNGALAVTYDLLSPVCRVVWPGNDCATGHTTASHDFHSHIEITLKSEVWVVKIIDPGLGDHQLD